MNTFRSIFPGWQVENEIAKPQVFINSNNREMRATELRLFDKQDRDFIARCLIFYARPPNL